MTTMIGRDELRSAIRSKLKAGVNARRITAMVQDFATPTGSEAEIRRLPVEFIPMALREGFLVALDQLR